MCRLMFAAVAALAAPFTLRAQELPGRDLFRLPLGTMAEAPALASSAGGGFWNPATIALSPLERARFSIAAFSTPVEQGVNEQLGTAAYRFSNGVTGGFSLAYSDVADLLRTDTDPQSIGDEIPYHSLIASGIVAGRKGPATLGLALRQRYATLDGFGGRALSVDVGGVLDRPAGFPFRAAASSFLLSRSHSHERASGLAAIEGFLPVTAHDLRVGVSYQLDESNGDEQYFYGSGTVSLLDIRAGLARQNMFGYSTTRFRLGLGLRYSHYVVGFAREDGAAGLGASYQFLLSTGIAPAAKP